MVVRISRRADGSFQVASPRGTLGVFKNTTREALVRFLRDKANEIGEGLRVVDEFEQRPENVDWEKIMKPRW